MYENHPVALDYEFETWSERGQDRSAIQHYRIQTLDDPTAAFDPSLIGLTTLRLLMFPDEVDGDALAISAGALP